MQLKLMDIFRELIIYGSVFSPLIALFAIAKAWKLNHEFFLPLYILILTSFIIDVASLILAKSGTPNLFAINIYGIIEFACISALFVKMLNLKKLKFFFYTLVLLLVIQYLFSPNQINPIIKVICLLIILSLCLIGFHNIYITEENIYLEKNPLFWVMVGILFYSSVSLFSWLLSSRIFANNSKLFINFWIFHNIANISKNFLFALGIWRIKPTY